MNFKLVSKFKPAGSQPDAIKKLTHGINSGQKFQTLLGITGSGKTFSIANVIEKVQKPTLVIAHNKTLAAQLCQELRTLFPKNAVEYFVSYYDYYQPEAYLPNTDTYIEKDADINEEIEKLRHSATSALLTRQDVIVVATVSCIYGLGSPEEYKNRFLYLKINNKVSREQIINQLIDMYYTRNQVLTRGVFNVVGDTLEVFPPGEEKIYRININNSQISRITVFEYPSRNEIAQISRVSIPPAKHFVVGTNIINDAIKNIKSELKERVEYFLKHDKITEAERLERRTNYDLEMIQEIGYCKGIENYSLYLSERNKGQPPYTLMDFFPDNFLTVIDESHVTIPQLNGMYQGDKSRKETLIEYGFRLPSALDNRPLRFPEFEQKINQTVFMSATPGQYEKKKSSQLVEQIIRPTGLVDPQTIVKPITGQVTDVIKEIKLETKKDNRVLVTTLTKKMAEDLAKFLEERQIKARYLHSEVATLERIRILQDLRKGKFNCLVGVNLLREGLDLPEVSLVAILDADKEGFLRSETSLVQTIGRAARNVRGRVILYADVITNSMKQALAETERRRKIQIAYNKKHYITPSTIVKRIEDFIEEEKPVKEFAKTIEFEKIPQMLKEKEREMRQLAKDLRFEDAALLRDEIVQLKRMIKL